MRWNASQIVFVALAAGYVALGLYGKWRKLKEDYHVEREKRQLVAEQESRSEPRGAEP